jgi:hypothetical protein
LFVVWASQHPTILGFIGSSGTAVKQVFCIGSQ